MNKENLPLGKKTITLLIVLLFANLVIGIIKNGYLFGQWLYHYLNK